MRLAPLIGLYLCSFISVARADIAPDPDEYSVCDGQAAGDACMFSKDLGAVEGSCVSVQCPADPMKMCLRCEEDEPSEPKDDGCGCRSASGSAAALGLLALLGLAAPRRTRRQTRPS